MYAMYFMKTLAQCGRGKVAVEGNLAMYFMACLAGQLHVSWSRYRNPVQQPRTKDL